MRTCKGNEMFGLLAIAALIKLEACTAANLRSLIESGSCYDSETYISPMGFNCAKHAQLNCLNFGQIGFTDQELYDLVNSCPISCNVTCGTFTLSPSAAPSSSPTTSNRPTAQLQAYPNQADPNTSVTQLNKVNFSLFGQAEGTSVFISIAAAATIISILGYLISRSMTETKPASEQVND